MNKAQASMAAEIVASPAVPKIRAKEQSKEARRKLKKGPKVWKRRAMKGLIRLDSSFPIISQVQHIGR